MPRRIPGAFKIGAYWSIPEDAEKPEEERIKSGKYVTNVNERKGNGGRYGRRN